MSRVTKIEWADRVWNPVVGCTPASLGCVNCYAQRMYHRFYQDKPFSEIQLHPERLDDPIRWRNPSRVFVDSMSDLFHPDVPMEYILRVWIAMTYAQKQTFLILTKRPERMKLFVEGYLPGAWGLATATLRLLDFPLPNVWLGVSAEDQRSADERIPVLLGTPAAKRFVSVEPMLGPVNLTTAGRYCFLNPKFDVEFEDGFISGMRKEPGLDWVICGGETGPGARPLNPDWVKGLRDQCVDAQVPFFFKGWGEWAYEYNGKQWQKKRVGKGRSGRLLEGQEWSQEQGR